MMDNELDIYSSSSSSSPSPSHSPSPSTSMMADNTAPVINNADVANLVLTTVGGMRDEEIKQLQALRAEDAATINYLMEECQFHRERGNDYKRRFETSFNNGRIVSRRLQDKNTLIDCVRQLSTNPVNTNVIHRMTNADVQRDLNHGETPSPVTPPGLIDDA